VPEDPGSAGKPQYYGDVVVSEDSPIHSFADLAGRTIGCNDEVSLSGHFAFRIAAREFGADPDTFSHLCFTGGHQLSLDRVVSGELDAAVVDSVVRSSRCTTDPEVASLRVIERRGPWPVPPLVARSDLDPSVIAAVREALLASNDEPLMQAELRAASLARFVPVTADHYLPIRAALAADS
jgi:ABC-type phosphate/phosphonate transport system substrate-binding protein